MKRAWCRRWHPFWKQDQLVPDFGRACWASGIHPNWPGLRSLVEDRVRLQPQKEQLIVVLKTKLASFVVVQLYVSIPSIWAVASSSTHVIACLSLCRAPKLFAKSCLRNAGSRGAVEKMKGVSKANLASNYYWYAPEVNLEPTSPSNTAQSHSVFTHALDG